MITDDYDEDLSNIVNLLGPLERQSSRVDGVLDFLISEYNPHIHNITAPPPGYADVLAHSMTSANPKFKRVLSKRGESSLKKIIYDPSVHKQEMCPITQTDFDYGDQVTELPCAHYFDTEAIDHWLKHEKAECPVCRMMLDNDEVGNSDDDHDANDHDANDHDANDHSSLVAERITLFNSLSRISDAHPFGPRLGMEHFVNAQDDDDLQTAIITSLLNV